MRAALIGTDGSFTIGDEPGPVGEAGARVVAVSAAAIGPTDLMRAAGFFGPVTAPYVPAGEGIGRLDDGRRVYFGHSRPPFGALGERTLVSEEEIWDAPDDREDDQILALGISGTGALLPLEEARIAAGESVLILGATGPVGQIGAQVARLLGARRVVAAARNGAPLEAMQARGWADAIAVLGQGDDEAALKAVADGGYDVVLDVVYGPPAEAAMRATRPGARMMSIGVQAGQTVSLSLRDLVFRTHTGVGTGQRPAAERRAAFERLMAMAQHQGLRAETHCFSFAQAREAWAAQATSPYAKIVVRI
jgi:NADPH:quinone reductase-like Zn-dependent oxidoreductase